MCKRELVALLRTLIKSAYQKQIIFLFLNQNICCGYSKEPYQLDGSYEHPKHMLKLMDKKIFKLICLSKPMFTLNVILMSFTVSVL